jgi:4'-phosphopantetheinyl transferase
MLLIRWLVESTEPSAALETLEQPSTFLCEVEEAVYETLKSEKRRRDWLLGRRTAKRLLRGLAADWAGRVVPMPSIIIAARPDGSPGVRWDTPDMSLPEVSLSISHSHSQSFCAAIAAADFPLGADIEIIEPRPPGFAADYFTLAERDLVEHVSDVFRPTLETAIWSAKEAAFKAIRSGLTVDTRTVSCLIRDETAPDDWTPFDVVWELATPGLPALGGWWRVWQEPDGQPFVLTLAAETGLDSRLEIVGPQRA